jgi:glycosyltransferase involved in cell wall biosynthesis
MMHPAISLITPTRNRPELLRRTVASVQAQALSDWEMIVVDDGDGAGLEAVRALNDPRVRALPNPGAGQVDARNAAVQEARGEYLHLLDDDDRWLDNHHLERVVAALETHSGLVHRGGWLVLEEPRDDGIWLETRRLAFDPPTTLESLRRDNTLLTSGVAYHRSLHEELGGFDSTLGNYWDWDWFLRASAAHGLLHLPEPTVLMSWRGSNTSRDPHEPQRVSFLERLSQKHDLGAIPSKNHFTVLGEVD